MKSFVQIITTPGPDSRGTSLLLHFDDKRYILGRFHEGLQRAGLDFGIRFLKVKDFFLTGKTQWSSTGGLLGMILTLADGKKSAAAARADLLKQKAAKADGPKESEVGNAEKNVGPDLDAEMKDPTLRIHGGPNLAHTLATARRFIFRQGMPINVQEFEEQTNRIKEQWNPDFQDERIRVWALPIKPETSNQVETDDRPKTPRKRSLDEYIDHQHPTDTVRSGAYNNLSEHTSDQRQKDQKTRHAVVSEMFQSNWRYDRLIETTLNEVKMPATIFVRDPATKELSKYEGPRPEDSPSVSDMKVFVREAWPGALIDALPPTEPSSVSISYILRSHKQRGKFLPGEAKRLGVKPGPLFAQLSKGENVKSEDGKIITPEMVLEPAKEGTGIAIIDLPSREYIPGFLRRPELCAKDIITGVGAFIWLLGPGVVGDERLLTFMRERPQIQHVVSSPDICDNGVLGQSAAAESIRHHQIDPIRYPSIVNDCRRLSPSEQVQTGDGKRPYAAAKQGLMLHLTPEVVSDYTAVRNALDVDLVRKEMPEEVLAFSKTGQDVIASKDYATELVGQDLPSPEAEIICLGTGSSSPSKHRNVSATLLRVPGSGSYLLDCGENTLGQLKCMFSHEELDAIWKDLKLIWISHLHADHHLGITSVIKAWYKTVNPSSSLDQVDEDPPTVAQKLTANKLFVLANPEMGRWLREYSTVEDFGYDHIIPLETTLQDFDALKSPILWNGTDVGFQTGESPQIRNAIRLATGLSKLNYCRVSHCVGAFAISLTFLSGFKFSFSGDCRPSKLFARIGEGSTVLLHEATFDDDMVGDAIAKKHSTISEAIGIGVAMQARRIILTHFSQRYSKLPNMDNLDKSALRLEYAEDVENGEDQDVMRPVDIPPEASASASHPLKVSNKEDEPSTTPDQNNDSDSTAENDPAIPPQQNKDMKVAVAFDFMRVKVKDIISLEKFNPAMRELYREREEDKEKEKERPESALSVCSAEKSVRQSKKEMKNQRRKEEKKVLDKERIESSHSKGSPGKDKGAKSPQM